MSKASFYWHFEDRMALFEAPLKRWEEATEAVIAVTEQIADPRERPVRLAEEAFGEVPGDGSAEGEVFHRRAFELAVSDAA